MAMYVWIATKTAWSEGSLRLRLQPAIGPAGMAIAPWREWREEDFFNKATGKVIPDYCPQGSMSASGPTMEDSNAKA